MFMEENLPTEFSTSTKAFFFRWRFHTLQPKSISAHVQAIRKLCSQDDLFLRELSTPSFWLRLKASEHQEERKAIKAYWSKIKPLAGLNAKQLLSLLLEEILPLEQWYQHIEAELQFDRANYESGNQWRPDWYKTTLEQIVAQTQQNLSRLKNLKKEIYQALLLRCEAHEQLEASPQAEDVVAVLCKKINALNILDKPLKPKRQDATLNSDRRIMIYDILRGAGISKDILQKAVLAPIHKIPRQAIQSVAKIKQELNHTTSLINELLQKLEIGGFKHSLFSAKPLFRIQSLDIEAFAGIRENLEQWGIPTLFRRLWLLRYAVYFVASFLAYFYLAQLAAPLLAIFFSAASINAFNSILFYTVGIAPIWYLSAQMLFKVSGFFLDFMGSWKKQQILGAMITLEKGELLIANQLSQSIVDISHFDIQELMTKVENYQLEIKKQSEKLNHYSFTERLLCKGPISDAGRRLMDRMQSQQKRIKTLLKLIAQDMAKNIGKEITLMCQSYEQQKLIPQLPLQQIEQLQKFVDLYGDENTIKMFTENTNVIEKWFKVVAKNKFVVTMHDSASTPYGGYEVRKDALNGWQAILNAYTFDPQKKAVIAKIVNMLKNEAASMTRRQFVDSITLLDPTHAAQNIRALQVLMFKTLPHRPGQANLLSLEQKKQIRQWYQSHHAEIAKAERDLASVLSKAKKGMLSDVKFNNLSDEQLCRYYELLDGADIYAHLEAKTQQNIQKRNFIREYFEDYQGENSQAYRLMRLVPDYQKDLVLQQIAKKRLDWMLTHLEADKISFDKIDGEMFHNPRLTGSSSFDFAEYIKHHACFKRCGNKLMEDFLKSCQKNGLDSGQLLMRYKIQKETPATQPLMVYKLPAKPVVGNCRTELGKELNFSAQTKRRLCV